MFELAVSETSNGASLLGKICFICGLCVFFWFLGKATDNQTQDDENDRCLSCGALLAGHRSQCSECGWSYVASEQTVRAQQFKIRPIKAPPPFCRLRRFDIADYETCLDLYRLNEPNRFPPGGLETFGDTLKDGSTLFVVCEMGDRIVAVAGVSIRDAEPQFLSLVYGLVHPSMHGKGLGTIMLVARISLLKTELSFVTLSAVDSSASFYAQFGFDGPKEKWPDGCEFWNYWAQLSPEIPSKCREFLSAHGVEFKIEGISIPFAS